MKSYAVALMLVQALTGSDSPSLFVESPKDMSIPGRIKTEVCVTFRGLEIPNQICFRIKRHSVKVPSVFYVTLQAPDDFIYYTELRLDTATGQADHFKRIDALGRVWSCDENER